MNRPHMAIRATIAVLSVFVLSTLCLTLSGSSMPPKIVEEKEFTLIGIAARTNNAKEMTDGGVIPAQWNKFFSEGTLAKIPNKVDTNICAVYTDYASDRNGDYTYFIGAKVSDAIAIPPGMVMKTVPAGKYSVVTSAKGPVQKVVPLAWNRFGLWKTTLSSAASDRTKPISRFTISAAAIRGIPRLISTLASSKVAV